MKRNNMLLFAAAAALTLSALTGCTVRTAVESEPIRQTGTNGAAVSRLAAVDQGTQTAKAIRYPEIELTYDRNGRCGGRRIRRCISGISGGTGSLHP